MNKPLLIASLDEALQQGESLLETIPGNAYTQRVPVAFNATIGGHYRHILEHIDLLLSLKKGTQVLDYDVRARNIELETSRAVALEKTLSLRQHLETWDEAYLVEPVTLRSRTSYDLSASAVMVPSNLGREALFLVAHTVHHFALIGLICNILQIELPPGFGIAPSTLKHQAGVGSN